MPEYKFTEDEVQAIRDDVRKNNPLSKSIWEAKYKFGGEKNLDDTVDRVVDAVYAKDPSVEHRERAREYMKKGYLIGAGRIMSGAGTGREVTLNNCYISGTMQDSMPGIQKIITQAALTMQQGGGIGTDYSTLRPKGALVKRTGSVSSGPLTFADQQNAMCDTVVSAGARRGAMMITLRDDHPDLWHADQDETFTDDLGRTALRNPSFITAKRDPWRLRRFNMSILVSDAFMKAVEDDAEWDLGFHVPRADGDHVAVYDRPLTYDWIEMDNEGNETPLVGWEKGSLHPWYVYTRVKARTIWDSIMKSTYTYAEPGVLFIDQINAKNNLNYCETISCVNPCGEEVGPTNLACCLGSVNVADMVKRPFTSEAEFDFSLFGKVVQEGVRFLDNVIDISHHPLLAQQREAEDKRRIGLGITGFGDALLQLGRSYGDERSISFAEHVSCTLKTDSYFSSARLAGQRGPFPLFNQEEFEKSYLFTSGVIEDDLKDRIRRLGLRNGVINTVAPNGTISMAFAGNCASGLEPVFAFEKVTRRIRQEDGSVKNFESTGYSYSLYERLFGTTERKDLPEYFVGAMDISPEAHVRMLAAWQKYVDASCSKTTNCPTDLPFEDFKGLYKLAYDLGAKGCTTYRPNADSGLAGVLIVDKKPEEKPKVTISHSVVTPRPVRLEGATHKVKWPLTGMNWYITLNRGADGTPAEMFISTRDAEHQEWVQALSCAITAILRRCGDIRFLTDELKEVCSAKGGAFMQIGNDEHPRFYPSIVAAIGAVLESENEYQFTMNLPEPGAKENGAHDVALSGQNVCPKCGANTIIREGGCKHCSSCDYAECG